MPPSTPNDTFHCFKLHHEPYPPLRHAPACLPSRARSCAVLFLSCLPSSLSASRFLVFGRFGSLAPFGARRWLGSLGVAGSLVWFLGLLLLLSALSSAPPPPRKIFRMASLFLHAIRLLVRLPVPFWARDATHLGACLQSLFLCWPMRLVFSCSRGGRPADGVDAVWAPGSH